MTLETRKPQGRVPQNDITRKLRELRDHHLREEEKLTGELGGVQKQLEQLMTLVQQEEELSRQLTVSQERRETCDQVLMMMEGRPRPGFHETGRQKTGKDGDEPSREEMDWDEVMRRTDRPASPDGTGDAAGTEANGPEANGPEPKENLWWESSWQEENGQAGQDPAGQDPAGQDPTGQNPAGQVPTDPPEETRKETKHEAMREMRQEMRQEVGESLKEAQDEADARHAAQKAEEEAQAGDGQTEEAQAGPQPSTPAQKRAVMQSQIQVIEDLAARRNGLITVKEAAEAISKAGLSQQDARNMRSIVRRRLNSSPRFARAQRGKYKLIAELPR